MTAAIPLAASADATLARLAAASGVAMPDGATLLGERAALHGLRIPGRVAAGGSCRLLDARDGVIALNLARAEDRELLPALFGEDALDFGDDAAIAASVASRNAADLVAGGREMGLAIAALQSPSPSGEGLGWGLSPHSSSRKFTPTCPTPNPASGRSGSQPDLNRPGDGSPDAPEGEGLRPRILDLSALWAGPLAAHLLWLAGAEVIKVESRGRPDAMRGGQPEFYALLNQGKASVALDPREPADRDALMAMIAGADIVIEAARPRALLQLGIDADALVAAQPGLVWITITGHGMRGDAANWIGFGDDCGVAGGLSAALQAATGRVGFVGDAIADPLTGIAAALAGYEAWAAGAGGRIDVGMAPTVARALADERARDPERLDAQLRRWALAEGQPFPMAAQRPGVPARPFGADAPAWRTRC